MTRALLINPTIHDFAAYDFWAKPLGLQLLAALLEANNIKVDWLDLADPLSPYLPKKKKPKRKPYGHGKFPKQFIPRPKQIPNINRRYGRYGLPLEVTKRALDTFQKPDAILITSMMTYWYPGVFEAINQVKEKWPDVPVFLGGVYATLCAKHATKFSNADHVIPGPMQNALPALSQALGVELKNIDPGDLIPAHHLAPYQDSAALLTSVGCPYSCTYCGVKALQPKFIRFAKDRVLKEISYLAKDLKIEDLAIYDDAFLLDEKRALEILQSTARIKPPVRFHAASGLSCKGITPQIAKAMQKANFTTVRIGLETWDRAEQKQFGGKLTTEDFLNAMENLKTAGYDPGQIGVYVMCGVPGQTIEEVEQTITEIFKTGARPHLSEYSPVPQSPAYEKAAQNSALDLSEPLFHNPSLLPCRDEEFSFERLHRLKSRINNRVRSYPPFAKR